MNEIVAERDRSVVRRVGDDVVKEYRRPDPRNEVERQAYEHLAGYAAPVPAYRGSATGRSSSKTYDRSPTTKPHCAAGTQPRQHVRSGSAYAALHDVPPPGAGHGAAAPGRRVGALVRSGRRRGARPPGRGGGVRRARRDARVLPRRSRAIERTPPRERRRRADRLRIRRVAAPRVRHRGLARPVPARQNHCSRRCTMATAARSTTSTPSSRGGPPR